jgi:hypothetical protein
MGTGGIQRFANPANEGHLARQVEHARFVWPRIAAPVFEMRVAVYAILKQAKAEYAIGVFTDYDSPAGASWGSECNRDVTPTKWLRISRAVSFPIQLPHQPRTQFPCAEKHQNTSDNCDNTPTVVPLVFP